MEVSLSAIVEQKPALPDDLPGRHKGDSKSKILAEKIWRVVLAA